MKKIALLIIVGVMTLACVDPIDLNTTQGFADLEINMLVDNTAPTVGEIVRFTITLKNSGYDDAQNVSINTRLPSGFTFMNAVATRGDFTNPNRWFINRLYRNTTEVLLVDAMVNTTGDFEYIVEVAESFPSDPDSTPNNLDSTEDDIASITINQPIVECFNDTFDVYEDEVISIAIFANDINMPLNGAFTILTAPQNGNISITDPNGTPNNPNDDIVSYISNANFNGTDAFVYMVCDTASPANCSTATVLLNVLPTPDAFDDTQVTTVDTPVAIAVYTNDNDIPTAGSLTVVTPNNGTATINDGGTPTDPSDDVITYTPNASYIGTDTFSYTICDNASPAHCSTANVMLTVN